MKLLTLSLVMINGFVQPVATTIATTLDSSESGGVVQQTEALEASKELIKPTESSSSEVASERSTEKVEESKEEPTTNSSEKVVKQEEKAKKSSRAVVTAAEWMPDENLRNAVTDFLGLERGADFTKEDLQNHGANSNILINFDATGYGIENLKGIKYFKHKRIFRFDNNNIKTLDFNEFPRAINEGEIESYNTVFQLDLQNNNISEIIPPVNGGTLQIADLNLSFNKLKKIDISYYIGKNDMLNISNNQIENFIFNKTKGVPYRSMDASNNNITNIDGLKRVADFFVTPSHEVYNFSGNKITDISKVTAVKAQQQTIEITFDISNQRPTLPNQQIDFENQFIPIIIPAVIDYDGVWAQQKQASAMEVLKGEYLNVEGLFQFNQLLSGNRDVSGVASTSWEKNIYDVPIPGGINGDYHTPNILFSGTYSFNYTIRSETPPPVINPTNPGDKEITGKGEPGYEITVTFPDGSTGTTTVKPDGTWAIPTPPSVNLNPGDVVTGIQTNPGTSKPSKPTEVIVSEFVEAKLTVNFSYSGGEVLPDYTTVIEGLKVGDKVDLASNQAVKDKIAQLEAAGYTVATRPENEAAFAITEPNMTAQYTVIGNLTFKSAPTTINFGSLTYNGKVQRVDNPTVDGKLEVVDTRQGTDKTTWQMKARVEKPMTHATKDSVLVDALQYNKNGEAIVLTGTSNLISEKASGGSAVINDTWGTTKETDGVKLVVDPKTSAFDAGSYDGVITWSLETVE